MTDLLSREKDFHKLNEQLDKMAATTLDQQHHQQQHQQQPAKYINGERGQQGGLSNKTDTHRFHTYTKFKGQSSLLKKRGAGDGSPLEPIVDQTRPQRGAAGGCAGAGGKCTPVTTTNTNAFREDAAILTLGTTTRYRGIMSPTRNQHHPLPHGPPHAAPHAQPHAAPHAQPHAAPHSQPHPPPHHGAESNGSGRKTTRTAANTPPTSTLAHRKTIKAPESSTRSHSSRTSNRSTGASFTVKYRNPKFVQSPSLEIMLREESASLQNKSMRAPMSPIRPYPSSMVYNDSTTTSNGDGSIWSPRRIQLGAPLQSGATAAGSKKQYSTDGLIKFLKSKIMILEEDHERISQEMMEQKELLDKTLERHKKVEQQRDQAFGKNNTLSEQLARAEEQLEEAGRRVKDRISEHSSQQKELEIVKRELKLLTQTNINLDKRLYRANEELEHTKNTLALMKNTERELKDSLRTSTDGKDKQIRSLKKQRADLLNAYKKQLFLIDNLKRQNTCMEQSKMIGFGEKEFTKVLDWDTAP